MLIVIVGVPSVSVTVFSLLWMEKGIRNDHGAVNPGRRDQGGGEAVCWSSFGTGTALAGDLTQIIHR
ncbi:hypothetical protein [Persicobacter diffluens]|uniref:hypothetical protein n=1 Tax=Persicobacter diffluens TaxID=981 RepID=UPI0030C6E915